MEGDAAGLFERAQSFEGSRQFHAVIGGVWGSAAEDTLVPAVFEHRRPTTGTGVSGTATVGIDDDVFQIDGVWVFGLRSTTFNALVSTNNSATRCLII